MRVRQGLRTGVALALGSLILTAPALAATKKAPRLFIAPSGGVRSGQVVKVRGVGFPPHDTVYLPECLVTATNQNGCNVPGIPPSVTIDAKGSFGWTKFKVVSGKIGSGTCGTTKADLKNCAISAGNAAGKDSATLRITFLAPKK